MEEKNERVEESGLSLKDIFFAIRKHLLAIILFIVIFTGVGIGFGTYKEKKNPSYTAYGTMMVSSNALAGTNAQITTQYQLSKYLVTTLVSYSKSNKVLVPVAEEKKVSVAYLKSHLRVGAHEDEYDLIFDLAFTSGEKQKSIDMLNSIIDSIYNSTQVKEEGSSALLYKSVEIIDKADNNNVSYSSSKKKYILVFAALGFVVAAAYVVLREMFDNSFKSSEQIESELGIRVISSIPLYEFDEGGNK